MKPQRKKKKKKPQKSCSQSLQAESPSFPSPALGPIWEGGISALPSVSEQHLLGSSLQTPDVLGLQTLDIWMLLSTSSSVWDPGFFSNPSPHIRAPAHSLSSFSLAQRTQVTTPQSFHTTLPVGSKVSTAPGHSLLFNEFY